MVYIDKELCKSCRICLHLCPMNVFDIQGETNRKGYNYAAATRLSDCISCGICERGCPDFAIHAEKDA